MHALSVRSHLLPTSGFALLAVLVTSTSALAQDPVDPAAPPPATTAAPVPAAPAVPAAEARAAEGAPIAGVPAAPVPEGVVLASPPPPGLPLWQKAPGNDYLKPGNIALASTIEWHGNMETDIGYASYSFSSANYQPERFNDFRGRFVLGPVIEHRFGGDHFVRATGQAVTWIRDGQQTKYQINADDVFVQAGKKGVWDLKVGRFMSWTVYRKGLGFDLYTLEDTGALRAPPVEGGSYGARYEVNNIWYRENNGFSPGRLALHLYPAKWAGIELLGQYARNMNTNENQLGGRAALNLESQYVSFMGGAEYLQIKPGEQRQYPDLETGDMIVCKMCAVTKRYGFGGGLVGRLSIVEVGANVAVGYERQWNNSDGQPNSNAETTTRTMGGYLQLDVGKPVFGRPFILGGGINETHRSNPNDMSEDHGQYAGYAAYPLGFNNALIKFVLTQSKDKFQQAPGTEIEESKVVAARVRFAMYF